MENLEVSSSPIKCVARRHMKPHLFVTYDAMRACCGSTRPFKFFGGAPKLANLNNRSPEQERQALVELVDLGWAIPLNPRNTDGTKHRRRWQGRLVSDEYRVLDHDEYVAAHGDCCPAPRYDERTGRPLTPGRAAPGLERANLRKLIGPEIGFSGELGDQLLSAIADAIHSKKAGTTTGAPVQATTDRPVQATTGTPVTSITSSMKDQPTNQPDPPAPEKPSGAGRLAGWIRKNFPTMSTPKGKPKEVLDSLAAKHGETTIVAALNRFLNRPDGFAGVKQPWALFISEADNYIGQVVHDTRKKDADDFANRRAGEKLKEQTIAELDGMTPPLTESERASLQARIEWAEASSSGIDYYIMWQNLSDAWLGIAADIRRKRTETQEAADGGTIEDYL